MEYETTSLPEYAGYRRHDDHESLFCPCGAADWRIAKIEEGIGGRQYWSIGEKYGSYLDWDHFGCAKCRRIVSVAFPVVARDGEPAKDIVYPVIARDGVNQ